MSDALDDWAKARADGSLSRRRAMRLLLGASSTAVIGTTLGERFVTQGHRSAPRIAAAGAAPSQSANGVSPPGPVARPAADTCPPPLHRRALKSVDDCPDNRVPKPSPYTPSTNGCGPAGIGGYLVPDDDGAVSFTPACDAHDRCYGTCRSDKATCDQALADDMKQLCRETWGRYNPMRYECESRGDIYRAAVADEIAGHIGQDAYNQGQFEGCDCCKPLPTTCVRCSCTSELFTDELVCLDNCQVSLGCFTGICEPVPAGWCADL